MITDAELLRVKVALDGMRQVTSEVKTGTATIVADVKKVQAENVRTTRTQEQYIKALYGGAAAAKQQSAATRQQNQATAAATARERERRIVNDQLAASIHRQVTQAQQATRANQQLAESSKKVSNSQRDQSDRMATYAKGTAAIAAGIGAARFVAMGGMSAIRRFEAAEAFPRATRASMGITKGTALAARADEFADRMGLQRETTRSGIMQLAGTGEISSVDEIVKTLEAFMALAQKGGATSEGRERAFTQYVQTASAGKLQGDELRLIQEAGVPLRRLIQDAGMGSRVGSQTDPLTFKEINKALLQYGGGKEAQGMLKEGADTATASLNRLSNASNDLTVPIGKVLTPVVTSMAGKLTAWEKSIDPAKLEGFTEFLVNFGPAGLGAIGVFALGVKGYTTILGINANRSAVKLFNVASSGAAASTALTQLAGAAGAARVAMSSGGASGIGGAGAAGAAMAGGVGYKPGTSSATYGLPYTQATRAAHVANVQAVVRRQAALDAMNQSRFPAWVGKAGRGAAGIARGVGAGLGLAGAGVAGSMAGEALAGQVSGGNEWARTGGAIAGGVAAPILAQAGAAGVAKIAAAKFGAGAATGAGGLALAAGAGMAGTIGLGVMAVEALTGVAGTDKSFLVEMENRARGNGTYNERAKAAQDQERLIKVMQEINVIRRTFQGSFKSHRLPTTDEIMHFAGGKYSVLENLVKERDRLSGRAPSESARQSSPYNRQAEAQAGSQRNVHAR